MNAKDERQTPIEKKLQDFLDRACRAESEGNCKEAERLFKLALFCEGTLKPGVASAREYVSTASPVYR